MFHCKDLCGARSFTVNIFTVKEKGDKLAIGVAMDEDGEVVLGMSRRLSSKRLSASLQLSEQSTEASPTSQTVALSDTSTVWISTVDLPCRSPQ